MNELQIFNSEEFGEIRTVTIDNEIYFVGKDVAVSLGYKDTSDALKKHVADEDKLTRCFSDLGWIVPSCLRKAIIDHVDNKLNNDSLSSLGQRGGMIINESGLYSLIFSYQLPSAIHRVHGWSFRLSI